MPGGRSRENRQRLIRRREVVQVLAENIDGFLNAHELARALTATGEFGVVDHKQVLADLRAVAPDRIRKGPGRFPTQKGGSSSTGVPET
jgi:hypothetical protein